MKMIIISEDKLDILFQNTTKYIIHYIQPENNANLLFALEELKKSIKEK